MSRGRNRSSGNRRRRSPPAQSHRFAEAIEQSPARSRAAIFSSVWRAQSTRERPLRQVLVSAVSREQRGYRRRISREYEPPGPRVSAGSKSGTLFLKSFGDSPPRAGGARSVYQRDVLRSVNGTASKCKTFLATATEECCPAIGTLAGPFTRRLSPSPMPGKRIQQQRAYLPLKRSSPLPQFIGRHPCDLCMRKARKHT